MYKLFLVIAFFVSAIAHASGETYKTYFENPAVDSRIAFTSCVVTGALFGIATGKPGDVLCWGPLVGDKDGKGKTYYVYKAADRKTQDYYVELESNLFDAAGDDAGGIQVWKIKLAEVDKNLESFRGAHVSTMKMTQSWLYSEGSAVVTGRLPGKKEAFGGPLFNLESVDGQLREFLREIGE